MLAFVEIEDERGPHGVPMSVATDPRADPEYYGPDAIRFKVQPRMDQAQHQINRTVDRILKDDPKADVRAYRFVVETIDYSQGVQGG